LADKAGIKRPTTYLQLEDMVKAGFMEKIRLNKKTLYKPRDPAMLEGRVQKNIETIEALKNEFKTHQTQMGMPQVSVYEGLENIKHLYEEMGQANFIRFWSNLGLIHSMLREELEILVDKMRENGINTREIIAENKYARRHAKYIKQIVGPTYSVRVANIPGLENDNAVTNKALYIFRLHEYNFFAVKIEDPTVVSAYRALFEMAWKDAKPL
jgi:sugar-specific transcriptional regulator TrmB